MSAPAFLALADGTLWPGRPFGARGRRTGEVVFNTCMTGYQEVLTDPSYCRQIVVMTAPHIGNTGVNPEDAESDRAWAAGFAVRQASRHVSSWRARGSLDDYLRAEDVIGIEGIDTRALVRHLRSHGAIHGAIVSDGADAESALALAREAPDINALDLVGEVSCRAAYDWEEPAWSGWYPAAGFAPSAAPVPAEEEPLAVPSLAELAASGIGGALAAGLRAAGDGGADPDTALPAGPGSAGPGSAGPIAAPDPRPLIIVYNFGVKRNTLRLLVAQGCRVTVVPARTPAAVIRSARPDGLLLSNGPGDPERLRDIVDNLRELLGELPIFGICLGHQLLGLALGGHSYKLKFGHRGGNQPVRDDRTGRVAISSHNHGYALAADGLPEGVRVTHFNLNDGCVEGLAAPELGAFSVQYHPEAAPGPHDALDLFGEFLAMVRASAAGR